MRLTVPVGCFLRVYPDRLAFIGRHLAQLDENGCAVAAGGLMRRTVRTAQVPASRMIDSVLGKSPVEHQNFLSAGMAVFGKFGSGRISDKAGCASLLVTNAVKHHALNAGLGRRYPLIIIRGDDRTLRKIRIQ
ncbi:hypothetical protein D3C86_1664660 [compost metagenome]